MAAAAGTPAPATHSGIGPLTGGDTGLWSSLISALLATAPSGCWHILLFFSVWGVMITLISQCVHPLVIQPTLLTVFGIVLGLVISYRTTSSFERYNEGRRYWSAIILGSRTFARIVWFHMPDVMPENPGDTLSEEEREIRVLIEKKTIINLIKAFAVSTKHHLRAEAGINYEDLYHLVKFLPPYALPAGLPSMVDLTKMPTNRSSDVTRHPTSRNNRKEGAEPSHLPPPATSGLWSPVSGSVKPRPGDESFLLPAHDPLSSRSSTSSHSPAGAIWFETQTTDGIMGPRKDRNPTPSGSPNPGVVSMLQLSISPIYTTWGAVDIEE